MELIVIQGQRFRPVLVDDAKTLAKKLRYFRLPPNLAHRKLTDLTNHRPSFMPYKVVGLALEFFESGSDMASGSKRTRERFYDAYEVIDQLFNADEDAEGISSGEESDLDRQLYDLNGDER